MTHRAHSSPGLHDRLIAAWGGRATIRRNLAIAVSDALALTLALQFALHVAGVNLSVGWTGAFSTVSRILTGLGIWLVSRAWLRFTGELARDDEGDASG